jgi:hypothetical protein
VWFLQLQRLLPYVGVVMDGSEDVHNGPGVVVGFCFHFGFCGGEGLRSNGSVGVSRSPVLLSIRLARKSLSIAVLIC